MYGWESGTIKKAECRRIDAFELWYWRRLLRVPWTARRSNQSILKEISPECYWKDWCWSWNSNTLATSCEEPTHWKRPWCWERLKAGGEGDDRGWDGWMASPTRWTWVWVSSGSWWWTGRPGVLQFMGSQRVRHDWATELNCTELESPSGEAGTVRVVSSKWPGSGDRPWSSWAKCAAPRSGASLFCKSSPCHHQGGRRGNLGWFSVSWLFLLVLQLFFLNNLQETSSSAHKCTESTSHEKSLFHTHHCDG